MTVIDTSGLVDFLLGDGAAREVGALLAEQHPLAAPDLIVFETLTVLRRTVQRGMVASGRAAAAVADLGDVRLELFPSLPMRTGAWELRENLTVADALFVTLAKVLGEPLATKDRGLAAAARLHAGVQTIEL